MQLSGYVEALRAGLSAATATAAPDVVRAGELLAAALEPTARLALLDLLSAAAAEVTGALPSGSVEVRLRGREPELLVIADPDPRPSRAPYDDEGTARVTLRLPETLKSRAEKSAAAAGLSLNAWLVRAVERALDSSPRHGSRRITGFARG